MDLDRPPDPPDTGGSDERRESESSSQQILRKRPAVDSSSDPSSKKTIVHPSTANPSIQSLYTHPSFSEGPKSYTDDDKGPFIVHVSRETPDPASGTTIRALKFGQFLHTHKIASVVKDGVKNGNPFTDDIQNARVGSPRPMSDSALWECNTVLNPCGSLQPL
ncbi:unnamed protein product [Euphydryas editha]|uniref:Uncharacterized protein n=1 Tax=Euphydryas editha TaxID=104508 RepID=A0AAU9V6E2_EUPED|nr:unnamed protein product [Euphydryas editha]